MLHALLIATALTAGAPPEVKMYGASWCGPCRAVRAYFEQNKIPHTYLDVDVRANHDAFVAEGGSAVPLVFVGRDKVVGANFEQLGKLLSLGPAPAPAGESYGGFSASWWQTQFVELRGRLTTLDAKIAELGKSATFDDEKERLEGLKRSRKLVDAALNQLENDASRVSLPRKYRG